MRSSDFLERHRKKPTDFTRKRSLPFPQLISFMLNMVNGSIQSELSRFFQIIQDQPVASYSVSAAAFSKARRKFSFSAFQELNQSLTSTFYEAEEGQRWNGLRLLAVDGSVIPLPQREELYQYFGKSRSFSSHPSARVSQLYDVGNKLTLDVQVAPHSIGERDLAMKHLEQVREGDLVLYDRGYPANWLFTLHMQNKSHFCARVPVDFSNIIKEFLASGRLDAQFEFPCIEKSLRKCRKLGLPTSALKLRLLRIKLKGKEPEVLVTSLLDRKQFPHAAFKDLYHQRWFVEEDYKLMKSRLEMENFSGLSVEAIKQDVHAKVLTKNIAAVAVYEADFITQEKYSHRKRKYRINFTYALSQMKDNVVRFIMALAPPETSALLIQQISKAVNALRPERSFSRGSQDEMRKRVKRHYMAYKRVG